MAHLERRTSQHKSPAPVTENLEPKGTDYLKQKRTLKANQGSSLVTSSPLDSDEGQRLKISQLHFSLNGPIPQETPKDHGNKLGADHANNNTCRR